MAEILFYHLTESTLDEALPGLVERSLGRGWRVTIQTVSEERRDALDGLLWTFSDTSFDIARGQWKNFKAGSHDLTYWQQTPDRRWERKA